MHYATKLKPHDIHKRLSRRQFMMVDVHTDEGFITLEYTKGGTENVNISIPRSYHARNHFMGISTYMTDEYIEELAKYLEAKDLEAPKKSKRR